MTDPVALPTSFDQFAFRAGEPDCSAVIKQEFVDFQVDEELGFEPTGSGAHRLLRIRKQDMSTTEVARLLADILNTDRNQVGYSGMKDRRAVTSQWFSVPESGAQRLDESTLGEAGLDLLETRGNDRKLRIGSHRANRFRIRLRRLQGDRQDLVRRLNTLETSGVPNYFGPQRLGRGFSNVRQAQEYFNSFDELGGGANPGGKKLPRKTRSMLLSASRSFLFNRILSRRVAAGNWDRLLDGEVLNLDGTRRFFKADPADREVLGQRLAGMDIHPTGLLAGIVGGRDPYQASGAVAQLETAELAGFADLRRGLTLAGVQASRRALRLVPRELDVRFDGEDSLVLGFTLGAGGYATSVLRELVRS